MPVVKSREYKDARGLGKKIEYIFQQKIKGDEQDVNEALNRIEPFLFTLYSGGVGVENNVEDIMNDMKGQIKQIQKRAGCTYYGENYINFSGKDFDLNNHDPEYITQVKYTMADMARKWVEIRGLEQTTWLARPHFDTDNAHVHILYTKNERDQKNRVHLTREAFLKAQNELNEYQQEYHPHLEQTFEKKIEPKRRQRSRQKDTQLVMEKQERVPTIRMELTEKIKEAMIGSRNLESVVIGMERRGFEVYERGGIPYGVVNGAKRYRFATLLKGTEYEETIATMLTNEQELVKARKLLLNINRGGEKRARKQKR